MDLYNHHDAVTQALEACVQILTMVDISRPINYCMVLRGCGILDCGMQIADWGLKSMGIGRAHRAWCVKSDDLKPQYRTSDFYPLSSACRGAARSAKTDHLFSDF